VKPETGVENAVQADIEPVETVDAELVDDLAVVEEAPDVPLSADAVGFLQQRHAVNTTAAYGQRWRAFESWCRESGVQPLPCHPNTLTNYVTSMAQTGLAPSTIEQAIYAIKAEHQNAGVEPPFSKPASEVLRVYRGHIAEDGERETKKARVLVPKEIRAASVACALAPTEARQLRDRLLVLLGFRTGRRWAEIAALTFTDVRRDDEGLLYLVRRTKTDRTGRKATWQRIFPEHHVDACAVRAYDAWVALLATRGITNGVLLRRVDRHGRVGGEQSGAGTGSTTGQLSRQAAITIWREALVRAEINPAGVSTHTSRRSAMTAAHRAGRDTV